MGMRLGKPGEQFVLESIINMYPIYHEMDILQFVDRMYSEIRQVNPETRLRRRREACGLSQSELAQEKLSFLCGRFSCLNSVPLRKRCFG